MQVGILDSNNGTGRRKVVNQGERIKSSLDTALLELDIISPNYLLVTAVSFERMGLSVE
jgi:hypothetical protein